MCLQVNAAGIAQNLSSVAVLAPQRGVSGLAVAACRALLAVRGAAPLHLFAAHCGDGFLDPPPQLAAGSFISRTLQKKSYMSNAW